MNKKANYLKINTMGLTKQVLTNAWPDCANAFYKSTIQLCTDVDNPMSYLISKPS